jgi:aspartyl/asparaginyl beta-hydroxylase (cupin superfamily)
VVYLVSFRGREEFPWLQHFEDNYEKIRDEVLTLRNQKGFQPYRGPSWISNLKAKDGVGNESVDSGQWNVFYLELHNMKFDYNC